MRPDPLPWSNEERLLVQLEVVVLAFAGTVGAGDTWGLYCRPALAASPAWPKTCSAKRWRWRPSCAFSKSSAVAPTAADAHAKLAQEAVIRAFTDERQPQHGTVYAQGAVPLPRACECVSLPKYQPHRRCWTADAGRAILFCAAGARLTCQRVKTRPGAAKRASCGSGEPTLWQPHAATRRPCGSAMGDRIGHG
jgi:hypothetical protein